ncbi:MAG: diguanylate cyclase [Bulleidia sp.]|nr:diguanylate cyclase [Bulleidia sp.]
MELRKKKIFHRPSLIIGLVLSGTLIASLWMNVYQTAQSSAETQGRALLASLDRAIGECTSATEALVQVVLAERGNISDFETIGESLVDTSGAPISSVQLAPAGVVEYIYPEQGNQAGKIDLLHDPDRREEALKAKNSGELYAAGPFELKQGGFGMAIRQPVYLNKDDLSSFWGFSIVIAKMDDLIAAANFASADELGYAWQLRAEVNGEEVYSGGSALTDSMVPVSEEMYGKTWTVYVLPNIWPQTRILTWAVSIMMVVLTMIISIAVQQAENLDRQRYTDALTGLRNRRGFDMAMEEAGKDASLKKLVLIAIDLNNFKSFNDIYGHDNGDVLLRSFADELDQLAGKRGRTARNGGDEFQILLKDPEDGWEKEFNAFFSRKHWFVYYGKRYEFLASAGYVVYPEQSDNFRDIYRMADTALYHAKSDPDHRFCRYAEGMSKEPREQLGFSFKDLSDGAPGAVLIYKDDETEQILYANDQCISLFGCESLGDFMTQTGGSFRNFVLEEDRQWAEESIVLQQNDPQYHHIDRLVYRVKTKDGSVKSVVDISRKFHHEYYGNIYMVFLMEEAQLARFDRKED